MVSMAPEGSWIEAHKFGKRGCSNRGPIFLACGASSTCPLCQSKSEAQPRIRARENAPVLAMNYRDNAMDYEQYFRSLNRERTKFVEEFEVAVQHGNCRHSENFNQFEVWDSEQYMKCVDTWNSQYFQSDKQPQ